MNRQKWERETLRVLASELSVKVDELIVLNRTNDPFYLVTENSIKGLWFTKMFKEVMAKFPHIKPHLRRLHYAYSSLPHAKRHDGTPYINDYNSWSYLCDSSKQARYNDLIGYKQITDRRNPKAVVNADFNTPHNEYEAPSEIGLKCQDIDRLHTLNLQIGYPQYNNAEELAKALAQGYAENAYNEIKYNMQKLQPYHLEVWIEKSTMNEELMPICARFNANFVYGLGQESITRVDELIERAIESGKPVRIFYISDYDDQGVTMPEAVARKVQFFNEHYHNNKLDIKLCHLALNEEQIEKYNLPKKPTKQPKMSKRISETISEDKLGKHLETLEKYGETLRKRQPYSVELDALATFHVGELERMLTEALNCFYDEGLKNKVDRQVNLFKQAIYEHIFENVMVNSEEITEAIEQVNSFYGDINATLRRLHDEALKIKKKVVQLKLYDVIDELQNDLVCLEDLELELPEPTVACHFEGIWLYDNTLGYVEQTERLKKHREHKAVTS